LKTDNNQVNTWILPEPINNEEIVNCIINYTLQKVLSRRGIDLKNELDDYLNPSELPNPEEHFIELNKATNRIIEACNKNEKIAICGDYDADGITSTVLLVELLSKLGASVIPYIPSRKEDGYGLNLKMINDISSKEIQLVITVDNGISAFDAINRSNKLGIDLIITDHHKIPNNNINIYALIHPERTPEKSPYKYLAGVGIAYILARNICQKINFDINQTTANELFCIGTVADMAPLVGANRTFLKEFLPKIITTQNKGIRSIIKKLSINEMYITADDIGYKIAPLINAVGRISNPKIIIDLLTSSSNSSVSKLTKECFAINKERKRITSQIEKEALDIAMSEYASNSKFLVLSKRDWHTGIIGIVAARIVDKFNLPAAIISEADNCTFRGSIRSNNLVKVNLALEECKDILIAYGGHSAAAGFSIKEKNIPILKKRLNEIAKREMNNLNLNKSIKPDAYITLKEIDNNFYQQLMLLGPFGIKNTAPIFWTRKCRILDIYYLKGNHVKMKLDDGTAIMNAVQWNSSIILKTKELIDIAFYIELNRWKKINSFQLNILDIKNHKEIIDLKIHNRTYKCQKTDDMKIKVTNSKGDCISYEMLNKSDYKNNKKQIYAKKILSFAEIALGVAS
tara:strand:- start:5186 stop:7075 length:1890 start_codon:yes stop_codon:yes gene_type:complete